MFVFIDVLLCTAQLKHHQVREKGVIRVILDVIVCRWSRRCNDETTNGRGCPSPTSSFFLPYFEFQIGAKVCDKNFFNPSLSLSLSLSLRTQERYWLFMRTNSIAYLIVSSRSSPGRRVTVSPS